MSRPTRVRYAPTGALSREALIDEEAYEYLRVQLYEEAGMHEEAAAAERRMYEYHMIARSLPTEEPPAISLYASWYTLKRRCP